MTIASLIWTSMWCASQGPDKDRCVTVSVVIMEWRIITQPWLHSNMSSGLSLTETVWLSYHLIQHSGKNVALY